MKLWLGTFFSLTVKGSFFKRFVFIGLALFLLSADADSFKYSCFSHFSGEVGDFGPRFFLDADPAVRSSITKLSQLKIFGQNFENLGVFKEKFREKILIDGVVTEVKTEKTFEKSENQKIRLALRIKKHNPDIIIGTEVKDIEAAKTYARDYLNDEYQSILIEGNDGRGIDICFFVRRSLPLDIELQSYKNYQGKNGTTPIFSRDLPVLLLRPAGSSKLSPPLMAIFGTHLKSRMGDPDGQDRSLPKRTEQVLASIEIMKKLSARYPDLPILMGGDFNNDIRTAAEFVAFNNAGFVDSMNIAKDAPPLADRYTQYFFTDIDPNKPGWEMIASQLDAMLVNSFMARMIVSSIIQRDISPDGTDTPMPKKSENVNTRGSDHDGIVTILDKIGLLAESIFVH